MIERNTTLWKKIETRKDYHNKSPPDKMPFGIYSVFEDEVEDEVENQEMIWAHELEGDQEEENQSKWPLTKFRGTPWWIIEDLGL